MKRDVLGLLAAALVFVAASVSVSAETNRLPKLESDLTIPELVVELEKRGFRNFDSIESGQRAIVVDVLTPDGDKVRLKYLSGTGGVVLADGGEGQQ